MLALQKRDRYQKYPPEWIPNVIAYTQKNPQNPHTFREEDGFCILQNNAKTARSNELKILS